MQGIANLSIKLHNLHKDLKPNPDNVSALEVQLDLAVKKLYLNK